MHACDVIVHTSTAPEPFGRVIVEGMLAGRPVIATNTGGPAEIVHEPISGLLVAPSAPIELANAIRRLLHETHLSKDISEYGYRYAKERYSLCRMAATVRGVVNRVFAVTQSDLSSGT
jgi:glycosyltransferase involved in cell wall biosynthesis